MNSLLLSLVAHAHAAAAWVSPRRARAQPSRGPAVSRLRRPLAFPDHSNKENEEGSRRNRVMGRTTVHRKKPRGPRVSTHHSQLSYMSSAPTRLPSPAALSSSSSRPIRFPSRCLRNLAVFFLCVGAALRPEDSDPYPPHASLPPHVPRLRPSNHLHSSRLAPSWIFPSLRWASFLVGSLGGTGTSTP